MQPPRNTARMGGSGDLFQTHSRRAQPTARRYLVYLALCLVAAVFLLPLFWMFSSSLKPEWQVLANPPVWIPNPPRWAELPRGADLSAVRALRDQHADHQRGRDRRPRSVVYPRGLRLRPAARTRQGLLVSARALDPDVALPGDHGAALRAVQRAGLDRHLPAAHRADLFRQRVLYLPAAAVLPDPSAGAGGCGAHRWRQYAAGAVVRHPADLDARPWRPW